MAGRPIGKAWREARKKPKYKEPIPASVADELARLREVAEAAKDLLENCLIPPELHMLAKRYRDALAKTKEGKP